MNNARRLVDSLRAKQPFKKALGQHFLVNDEVLQRTVAWAEVDVEDHVLEVEQVVHQRGALLPVIDASVVDPAHPA